MKRGKRYEEIREKIETGKQHQPDEAFQLMGEFQKAKFDETVDVSVRLGVDPKHADQMVRGSVNLPHGTGQTVRVLVFAKGEKEKEAKEAGADHVGAEEMAEKVKGGWLEFDKVVATPDMMGTVGKLGSVLGPRGMMPNPKTGTVSFEVGKVVKDLKAGKIDYRVDKTGIVHTVLSLIHI